MTVKGVGFNCSECGTAMMLHFAVILENGDVEFLGQCPKCGEDLRFKLDVLLAELVASNRPRKRGDGGAKK